MGSLTIWRDFKVKKRVAFIISMIISVSIFVSACSLLGKKDYPDPQDTIDSFLEALSEGDMEAAGEFAGDEIDFDISGYDETTKEFVLNYFELMTIEVDGKPDYDKKSAEVPVTVTVPDLKASIDAVINNEDNEFIVLIVKDFLLATLNGEDTTGIEQDMLSSFSDEIKNQMSDSDNQLTTETTMEMSLNEDEDGWIIDDMEDDFVDPSSVDIDSAEVSAAVQEAMMEAIPAALDLLLEEGSIDQATYDSIKASL